MAAEPLIAMRGITKAFPNVLANDRVDLDIYPGEVHALLGENGAGKSTLVKILYGFYRADSGEVRFRGQRVELRSPLDARSLGIGMVFQDFTLIPAMSVLENIALFLPRLEAIIDKRQIVKRIEELSERYGLEVHPWAPVWQLSIGEKQKVEILKLLLADARVLVLDEPTRVLAPHEVRALFQILDRLRADGYAIIFITHKLPEVLACADRITVMRRGRVAGMLLRAEATESALVTLMFGAAPLAQIIRRGNRRGESSPGPSESPPLLELRGVSTRGQGMATSLAGLDLTIRAGEIVGVAGVSGNGQKELGDVILGLERCVRGQKFLAGEDATAWSVAKVRAHGVAFIPEDPLLMAVVPWMSIQENMALGDTKKYELGRGFAVDWGAVRQDMERTFQALGWEALPLHAPARALSGGNLQRLALARELAREPKLIVALYPTRGLDVASAMAVRRLLLEARGAGKGVLLISEDLEELFSLSDQLIVLYQGRIVGQFKPEEVTIDEVGYLMTGAKVRDGHE